MIKEINVIKIDDKLLEKLVEEADRSNIEVAAVIFGKIKGNKAIATEAQFLKNIADNPQTNFSPDIKELYNKYLYAEENKLDLVGIFHSHPAPPAPSSTDIIYMQVNPIPWIILSKTQSNNRVKAYQFIKNKIIEVKIES